MSAVASAVSDELTVIGTGRLVAASANWMELGRGDSNIKEAVV